MSRSEARTARAHRPPAESGGLCAAARRRSVRHWTQADRGAVGERRRGGPVSLPAPASSEREARARHAHAARAWGLPAPLGGGRSMTFTAGSGPTRYRSGLRIGVAPLPEPDVAAMASSPRDVATTNRRGLRAVVTRPGRPGCRRSRATPRDGLAAELQEVAARRRGGRAGRRPRVLELATGRRETPIQSWAGWSFEDQGLPRRRASSGGGPSTSASRGAPARWPSISGRSIAGARRRQVPGARSIGAWNAYTRGDGCGGRGAGQAGRDRRRARPAPAVFVLLAQPGLRRRRSDPAAQPPVPAVRIRREDVDHVRERTRIDEVVGEHVTLKSGGVG